MLRQREAELLKLLSLICRYLQGEIESYEIDPNDFEDKVMRQRAAFIRALLELLERGTLYTTYGDIAKQANKYLANDDQIPLQGGALARVGGSALGIASVASMCCKGFLISSVVGNKSSQGKKPSQGFYEMLQFFGFPFSKLEDEQKKVHQFFKNRAKSKSK